MDDFLIFARRMKEAREREGIKQNELARDIGVTPQTISAYEKAESSGKGKNPTLENAVAIAARLKVSLDWLCGIEANSSKREAIKTFGDAAKMIVELEERLPVSFEVIRKTRAVRIGSDPDGYPVFGEVDDDVPAIVFLSAAIKNFLTEWGKIRNLREENTIDEKLYRLWIEDRLRTMSDPEFEIDLPF